LPPPDIEFIPAHHVNYCNLEPQIPGYTLLPDIEFLPANPSSPGIQIIQNRFFMYWVDIESRVRHDATVSSEIKLAFNTA
jgi:hypothetical protein